MFSSYFIVITGKYVRHSCSNAGIKYNDLKKSDIIEHFGGLLHLMYVGVNYSPKRAGILF